VGYYTVCAVWEFQVCCLISVLQQAPLLHIQCVADKKVQDLQASVRQGMDCAEDMQVITLPALQCITVMWVSKQCMLGYNSFPEVQHVLLNSLLPGHDARQYPLPTCHYNCAHLQVLRLQLNMAAMQHLQSYDNEPGVELYDLPGPNEAGQHLLRCAAELRPMPAYNINGLPCHIDCTLDDYSVLLHRTFCPEPVGVMLHAAMRPQSCLLWWLIKPTVINEVTISAPAAQRLLCI
jgi:hypothetical protein